MSHNGDHANKLAVLVGSGIGIVWIAMALFAISKSIAGLNDRRPDFGLAWGLVGVLLLAAGGSALVGTWWHNLRPSHHD
jgi:hypothetical protein